MKRFSAMTTAMVEGQLNRRVRRSVMLIGAFAAILLFPAVVRGASTVYQITHDSDRDAETSIAINPTNAQNMVAGWISSGDHTCGFGVSDDGGVTWSIGVLPGIQLASGGSYDRGTDPSVAFDKYGNAYFSCLAFNLGPQAGGSAGTVFVSKSTDGGHSWGQPQAVFNGQAGPGNSVNMFEDHQFLTANARTGELYVTETRFEAGHGKPEILFSKSTDQNGSWTAPVAVSDRGGNATFQHSFSAGGKDAGTIYVSYFGYPSQQSSLRRIYLVKSADGGAHFSEPQLLRTIVGLAGVPGNLKLAVDQTTNQIYLTYQDADDGNGEVRVLRVADAGDHFVVQGRTTVKTDPADQFFPHITVAPNGRVDVCFQDRGYLPGNLFLFTTCGFSFDGGLTFANQQVTTVPFDDSNNNFIGDYNWQASTNNAVYPIFVGDGVPGGDSSTQEVFVARVTP